jgi:hypothetical protein
MILLCLFILLRVKIPTSLYNFVGTSPGIIIMLGIIFYLFTESPILGVLGMIAGYELIQQPLPEYNYVDTQLPDDLEFTPTRQFQTTLEETVVSTMVPLVESDIPNHLDFKNSTEDTHNASPV